MRLLLDTNVLLWSLDELERLPTQVRTALVDPGNEVFVSAVVAWEIAIKVAIGKLPARADVGAWLPEHLVLTNFVPMPITMEHAVAVEHLPLHHRDPFDRLLIAQATVESLTIVTNDRQFERYQIGLLPCW